MSRYGWMMLFLVIGGALLFSACQPIVAEEQAMPTAEEVTQAFVMAWNEGKLEELDTAVASDFVLHDPPGFPNLEGLDAYKAVVVDSRNGVPDTQLSFDEAVIVGNKIYTRWMYGGTHTGESESLGPPTGQPFHMMGSTVARFDEGKIVEMWHSGDDLGMMLQLGMELGPPADDTYLDTNENLAHRYLEEMWDEGNMETAEEILADDFVDHYPRPGNAADKAGLMADAASFYEAGRKNRIDDMIVTEDTIILRVTVGSPVEDGEVKEGREAVILLGVEDGQITDRRVAVFGWE